MCLLAGRKRYQEKKCSEEFIFRMDWWNSSENRGGSLQFFQTFQQNPKIVSVRCAVNPAPRVEFGQILLKYTANQVTHWKAKHVFNCYHRLSASKMIKITLSVQRNKWPMKLWRLSAICCNMVRAGCCWTRWKRTLWRFKRPPQRQVVPRKNKANTVLSFVPQSVAKQNQH